MGSLVGAIKVVVAACQKRGGDRPEQTYKAVHRATDIAIDGLNSLPRPAQCPFLIPEAVVAHSLVRWPESAVDGSDGSALLVVAG